MNIQKFISALSENELEELKRILYINVHSNSTKHLIQTLIDEFDSHQRDSRYIRIINNLKANEEILPHVDLLTKKNCLRMRNFGIGSWMLLESILKEKKYIK